MKIWVDDIRTPPDDSWTWCLTSDHAISILKTVSQWHINPIEVMSLDHDLGIQAYTGKEDTTRPIVLWCCENDFWPVEVRVHSANYVGVEWLEGMISRYHPTGATNPERVEMSNCEGKYHPAVFLYGSATAEEAAKHWYESAMEVAKEANALRDELRRYKESRLHQWLEGMIERYKT